MKPKGLRPAGTRVVAQSVRLTVYLGQEHRRRAPHAADDLLRRAAAMRISGGTLLPGVAGFGHGRRLHQPTLWHGTDETPVMLIFVDTAERIDALLAAAHDLLPACCVVRDAVLSVRYIRAHEHR